MNIFFLHRLAWLAAIMHCDKHMKMIVEAAQMLSTALFKHTGSADLMPMRADGKTPYSGKAHPHHPSTLWVGLTRANYEWLCELAESLLEQNQIRYGKEHGCTDAIHHLRRMAEHIPDLTGGQMTPVPLAMPDEYKQPDRVQAYRQFYFHDKRRFARWDKGTPAPNWWRNMEAVIV